MNSTKDGQDEEKGYIVVQPLFDENGNIIGEQFIAGPYPEFDNAANAALFMMYGAAPHVLYDIRTVTMPYTPGSADDPGAVVE